MDLLEFALDVLATLLGGVLLSFLFFFAKERIFPLPKITGRWYFEQKTCSTSYNPYKDMILRYTAILCREGNRIEGTAEKIYENSSAGEREYIGENRTRAVISGYVEKNYLGKDLVYLHITENGHGRESSSLFKLTDLNAGEMVGTFSSMVAESSGNVRWNREPFSE